MRVATLASAPLTANSHPLSSILIDFELVQILMRVGECLFACDQSGVVNSHQLSHRLTGA